MDHLRRFFGAGAYQKLQIDDGIISEAGNGGNEPQMRVSKGLGRNNYVILYLNIAFLALNILSFASLYSQGTKERNQDLRQQSFYSPIFDRLDIAYTTKTINASLANEDNSIWRMAPSPEVDAAWERVSRLGYHTITGNDVRALGKDPSLTVKAPLSWNRGSDAHIVQLDMTHQIHCLNAIRKAMYPEHYPMRKLMKDVHPQHCLHVILQNLMCDASVDLLTYNWVETQQNPFPDMNISRKCRDFEAVLDWHEKNLVPLSEKIAKPTSDISSGKLKQLPLTPKLLELLKAHKGENSDETVPISELHEGLHL